MQREYSIAEARDQLPALVHGVEVGEPVTLTRRGARVAVLLSASEYDRLTSPPGNFLAAVDEIRARFELEALDLGDVFEGTRDPGPGRDFDWK